MESDAPRSTPAEIVDRLNKEINATLAYPKMQARLAELSAARFATSTAAFARSRGFIAEETEMWDKVVKFSGAKPD
jgi:tripartite-type tricarboxylate transporter receptor subunit TctC